MESPALAGFQFLPLRVRPPCKIFHFGFYLKVIISRDWHSKSIFSFLEVLPLLAGEGAVF